MDFTSNSVSLQMRVKLCFLGVMIVRQDVLWCPMFQVKTHPASAYVFMPVRLLDFSSPAVSTPRGIISGQSGTPDCGPPCPVKLLIYHVSSSNTHHNYLYHRQWLCLFRGTLFSSSIDLSLRSRTISFLICSLQRPANLPLHITIALFWGIYCPGLTSSFFLLSAPSAQPSLTGWLCSKSGFVKDSSTR